MAMSPGCCGRLVAIGRRLRGCSARIRRSRLVTIEPAMFLYMLSYFFHGVFFDLYAFDRYGEDELASSPLWGNHSSHNSCISTDMLDTFGTMGNRTGDAVESRTAILQLVVGVTAQLPSVVTCLVLGPLSDHLGRKPAMLVALLGACLQAVVSVLVVWLKWPLHVFLAGAAVRGVTGGLAGILTVSHSYIADVSSREWLTLRLGVLDALAYLAGTLSLGLGGAWIELSHCDFRYIAVAHLAALTATVAYFVFLVPESKTHAQRRDRDGAGEVDKPAAAPLTFSPGFGLKGLFRGFQIFFGRGYPRWKLWTVLATLIVTVFNATGGSVIIVLFLLHRPLEWRPYLIGVYLGAHELVQGLSLIVFLPTMVAIGFPDALISLLGLIIACVMNVCIGFVVASWEMFLGKFITAWRA